jgi:hypothetical protein
MQARLAIGFIGLWMANWALAQSVNREMVEGFLNEGEIQKAQASLEQSLLRPEDLTFLDSLYVLKNLGVLYATQPKKQTKSDAYFNKLLAMDPFASLHDTYASNTIIARFKKIRKEYQQRIGGKALVPTLALFDVTADFKRLSDEERVTLSHQAIGEFQRLTIFHTLDRSILTEAMKRMRKTQEECLDRNCRLDMARRMIAEKMATLELGRLDTQWVAQLTLIDVETGQTSTSLRKVFDYGELPRLAREGLHELADSLQKEEAAWFNLTLSPSNATLSVDGSPTMALTSRLALNPGKHSLCAESPGFASQCKEFHVKKNDAVTYAFLLKPHGAGRGDAETKPSQTEFIENEDMGNETSGPAPSRIVWFTLGGMGALAVLLLVVLNK